MADGGRRSEGAPAPTTWLVGGTIAAAVVGPSLIRGGYTAVGQTVLVLLAAAALLEVLLLWPAPVIRALRSPVTIVLATLGGFVALSALWTIGPPDSAIRWGLVILAYASLAGATGALVARCGLIPIAAGIALLAAVEAALGLGAAALRVEPMAAVVSGSWRPGGTLEYAAALGNLQVCALPVALWAVTSERRVVAWFGALALALAGATLGTVDSRFDLALAAAVLVALAVFVDHRRRSRGAVVAAVVLIAASAVAGALVIGGRVVAGAAGGGGARLGAIALVCFVLATAWPLIRAAASKATARRAAISASVCVVGAGALWVAAGYTSTLLAAGTGGLGHGRISYWRAAVEGWERRPVLGSGAETFYIATSHFQSANDLTLFAHDLPLELATELGVVGFALGLCMYAAAARDLRIAIRAPDASLLAPTVVCFLLANLIDWPWHLAGFGALWATATGALSATALELRDRSVDEDPTEPVDAPQPAPAAVAATRPPGRSSHTSWQFAKPRSGRGAFSRTFRRRRPRLGPIVE